MKVTKRNNKLFLHSELLDKNLNIKHIFSTVDFGNQGLHVGDIAEKVIENRKRLADFLYWCSSCNYLCSQANDECGR